MTPSGVYYTFIYTQLTPNAWNASAIYSQIPSQFWRQGPKTRKSDNRCIAIVLLCLLACVWFYANKLKNETSFCKALNAEINSI